jgi:tetratricopeptide (TPR) repeat protein
MNDQNYHTIFHLVSDYEAKSKEGSANFLGEKAFIQLIEFYSQEGQYHKALDVIEHAINLHNFSSDLYVKKAELLLEIGQEQEALTTLEKAAVYAPYEIEITLLKIEALVFLHVFLEAEMLIDSLKSHPDQDVLGRVYFLEGLLFEQSGQNERMYYALLESIRCNPENLDAIEHLWLCIELEKKYRESLVFFEELLTKNAYSSQIWYYLGHSHSYLGNYEAAIEAYEYSFIIDPEFEEAYRDCGELCFEIKNYEKAFSIFKQLDEIIDTDADILLRMGQCLQGLGKIKEAKSLFSKTVILDPHCDEAFFHLGEVNAQSENWESAIRYFRRAIYLEDSREEYYSALGQAYAQTGKIEKATWAFERATHLAPEELQYWLLYITFLIDNNFLQEAVEVIDVAEEESVGVELLYGKVVCLLLSGKRKEALYWLGEALIEDYEVHPFLFHLNPKLLEDSELMNVIETYKEL